MYLETLAWSLTIARSCSSTAARRSSTCSRSGIAGPCASAAATAFGCAGLATGGSVALAGAIGFVGIVAPHLIRPFVKHDPARSLIPSALLAGLVLVIADIGVRLLPTSNELKLGVVAALIGAPAFVWIAMKRRALNG